MKSIAKFIIILTFVCSFSKEIKGQSMYRNELENLKKQVPSVKRDSAIVYYLFSLSKLRSPGVAWDDSLHKFSIQHKSSVGLMLWRLKDIESDISNLNYEQGIKGILGIAKDLEKLNYKSYASFAYLRAGIIYVYSSDNFLDRKNAIPYYNKALQLAYEGKEVTEILRANDYMGELYFEMNDFEKAIFYLKKAEKLVEINPDKYMYPSIAASLSASYLQMGQRVNSQIYYDKMNYWLNESDLKFDNLYHVYINYIYQKGAASYFLKLKQYEKANRYALEGLSAIKQGMANRKGKIGKFENYSMNLLKILYVANGNQKNYEKAFLYLRELHEKQFIHQKSELNNLLQELNLKYQTEQNRLKITALENENLKKEAEKQTTFRFSFAILILLLLLVIGIVYYSNFRLRKKNKEISEAMLKGQTTERKRVASDLHDNLGSTMSSIRWAFQSIDTNKWSNNEKEIFSNVQVMFDKAYDDIRLLSHNLLPEEFERFGLKATLQNFIRKININTPINFNLTISEGFKRMDNRVEFEVYSICLELVNNIMKHSQATQAKIELYQMKSRVKLIISDNGIGIFNNDSDGKGMKNVQARVESLNGTWKIQNTESQGFVNEILIPV